MTVFQGMQPPNDHLTRELLRRTSVGGTGNLLSTILEQLLTESVYSVKDDFDKGDTGLWLRKHFDFDEHDLNGTLTTAQSDDEDDGNAYIASKEGWTGARRCTTQVRFRPTSLAVGQFSVGFVAAHPDDVPNGLLDVSGPTADAHADEWASVVFDARQSSSTWAIAARTGGGTPTVTNATPVQTPVASQWSNVLVAVNESPELFVWVNGKLLGRSSGGPLASVPQRLLVYAEHFNVDVDYIQAWQEREAV